jgi:hypothetical protein
VFIVKILNVFVPAICAAIIGSATLMAPAYAQQKTVKACEDEWKADKAGNQAKGITEKAYVDKCRSAGAAAKPAAVPAAAKPAEKPAAAAKPATPAAAAPAPKPAAAEAPKAAPAGAAKKTAKACEDEWKADKAGNQAKGITEKAYVEKCRGDATTAASAAAPAAAPKTAAPAAAPAAPAAPAKPAAATPAAAPAPVAKTAPTGANQFAAEAQAKAHCPTATVVWANLDSKIFHFAGHDDYGHTKSGAYMCETDALSQGIRAPKNEKHP